MLLWAAQQTIAGVKVWKIDGQAHSADLVAPKYGSFHLGYGDYSDHHMPSIKLLTDLRQTLVNSDVMFFRRHGRV